MKSKREENVRTFMKHNGLCILSGPLSALVGPRPNLLGPSLPGGLGEWNTLQ